MSVEIARYNFAQERADDVTLDGAFTAGWTACSDELLVPIETLSKNLERALDEARVRLSEAEGNLKDVTGFCEAFAMQERLCYVNPIQLIKTLKSMIENKVYHYSFTIQASGTGPIDTLLSAFKGGDLKVTMSERRFNQFRSRLSRFGIELSTIKRVQVSEPEIVP